MLEWSHAVLFKYFDDFIAVDTRAVAQEVADVGYGCLQGVKANGRLEEDIEPSLVVAVVGRVKHFGTFS